ncbi:uncharacterized protein Bfra_004017 [Botrytis fragariae]|uniref:BTB domain-containing protein n=1 Tax=Botrytis fragariae TaxID=1964551 RepID=A0A8H6EKH7_9HELO|nr:uncharacterized protein Bfra_004017 [Botrytis fragariae]KAF5875564.1 hypothetical protein Bfra_004017 [Botrytis fragariae]
MNPTQDLRKVTRWLGSPIVHIYVGFSSREFAVHKDLICYTSPFFRAAFTSGFRETNTGTIELPETDTEIFLLFMGASLEIGEWETEAERNVVVESTLGIGDPIERNGKRNYSEDPSKRDDKVKRKIQALMNALENETWKGEAETLFEDAVGKEFLDTLAAQIDMKANNKIHISMRKMLELYVFADMVQIPALKNCCIGKYDELRRGIKNKHDRHDHDDFEMTLESISYVWKNTRNSDLIRVYLLDSISWRSEPSIREGVIRKRDRGSPVDDLERYFERVDEDSNF